MIQMMIKMMMIQLIIIFLLKHQILDLVFDFIIGIIYKNKNEADPFRHPFDTYCWLYISPSFGNLKEEILCWIDNINNYVNIVEKIKKLYKNTQIIKSIKSNRLGEDDQLHYGINRDEVMLVI